MSLRILCWWLMGVAGLQAQALRVDTCNLSLERESVRLLRWHGAVPADGLYFVALHDNENTCTEVMLSLLPQYGGTFIELQARGERRLQFRYQQKAYSIDPNRIFSADSSVVGREAFGLTVYQWRNQAKEYNKVAARAVRPLAVNIQNALAPATVLVSLHNNFHYSDAGSYNLTWYLNGGREADQAKAIYVNPRRQNSEFFVVTDSFFFYALQKRGFNVVLQDPQAPDDGSLSVYCARQKIAYINIEAKHGRKSEQREMILAVYGILQEQGWRVRP